MKLLLPLVFLIGTFSAFAQDGEVDALGVDSTAQAEEVAELHGNSPAESDSSTGPIMTPYEEAAKSYALALDLEEQRRYDEAQAEYDHAIEVDPNFVEAYVKRGGIKFQKIEFPAAMEDYNRAVEIAENLVEMHEYKASIKKVLADYEGSKIEGSKADEMKTRLGEALFHRGHLKRFMEDNGGGVCRSPSFSGSGLWSFQDRLAGPLPINRTTCRSLKTTIGL